MPEIDSEDVQNAWSNTKSILKSFTGNLLGLIVILLVVGFFAAIIFRITCVNFVDNYEIGYRYDTFGANAGKIQILPRTGYIATWPFMTKIHKIDGRPMQVCISAINRVLNCKLVQFNPKGIEVFLQWHGRNDYSNEGGTREAPTTFNQILMNYAYDGSGKEYPFLTVLRELKGEDAPGAPAVPK